MSEFLEKLGDLREHIEKALEHWKVPGVAVSIVKDGKVVLAEGYGYKDVENKVPMTPDTVLPIGSASKSFTSMAAAMLVEEGKMGWDTPVTEYIPAFKMYDPVATQLVNVRDMLCHRTGMPRHDLMWAISDHNTFTREDLIRRVRYLESSAQFRQKAQYQNHMFATVGYAIEKVSGKTWEEFVQEKIMDELKMTDSNFSVADSQKTADFGLPYRHDDEKNIIPANFMELGAPGPAGSINSTANDMTKWMLMQLNNGKVGEKQLISEELLTEMHKPQMHYVILPFAFPEMQFPSLGLGWFTDVYRGSKMIHHGGNVTGFTALCALLPEENLGICILANMNSTFITYALRNEVFDRAMGITDGNWHVRFKDEIDKLYGAMDEGKNALVDAKIPNTKPSLEISGYYGEYEHPGYGIVIVSKGAKEGDLTATFNSTKLALEHYHYDQFLLSLDEYNTKLPSRFTIGVDGKVESLGVPFEGEIGKDIAFTRKIEADGSKDEGK